MAREKLKRWVKKQEKVPVEVIFCSLKSKHNLAFGLICDGVNRFLFFLKKTPIFCISQVLPKIGVCTGPPFVAHLLISGGGGQNLTKIFVCVHGPSSYFWGGPAGGIKRVRRVCEEQDQLYGFSVVK